ncbi:MAG: hypothetical protein OEY14_04605, partial [Myxococcales bacterium]|nr:hypothetical protein [Myxococcales bacterium]
MRTLLSSILTLAGLGLFLHGYPRLLGLDPVLGAVAAVGAATLLSTLLAHRLSPEALGLGAAGALVHALLTQAGLSPALAMGALLTFVFGARAARSRTIPIHLLSLALTFGCGAVAFVIVSGFGSAELSTAIAATLTATVLSTVPLALPGDDPLAFELRELARGTHGPLRMRMLRALVLRRRFAEISELLGARARSRMERAFEAMLQVARARAASRRSGPIALLDKRLSEYLRRLRRAVGAALATRAYLEGMDDAALAGLRVEQDDLESAASALVELDAELS